MAKLIFTKLAPALTSDWRKKKKNKKRGGSSDSGSS